MPPKLLLADDSITVQRVIALTFAGEELEIVTVGDGDEAVERIAQDRPDIVLADLSMPGGTATPWRSSSSGRRSTWRRRASCCSRARSSRWRNRDRGNWASMACSPSPSSRRWRSDWCGGCSRRRRGSPSESGRLGGGVATSRRRLARRVPPCRRPRAIGESRVATDVPAGYPFEPCESGRAAPPAALDDYFQRLDEALSSAGLEPSRSLRAALNGVTDASSDVETVVGAGAGPRATATPPQADDPSPRAEREETSADPAAGARETMTPAAPAVTAAPTLRLVDAFAALLDVEEGRAPDAALTAASEPAAPAASVWTSTRSPTRSRAGCWHS